MNTIDLIPEGFSDSHQIEMEGPVHLEMSTLLTYLTS